MIAAPTADPAREWMSDEDGVLELKLAHLEKDAVDGGVLRIDRSGRKLTWSGIPGEMGCKSKIDVSLDGDQPSAPASTASASSVSDARRGQSRPA